MPADAEEALAALGSDSALIYLVPLRPAGAKDSGETPFVWLVEFDKTDSQPIAATLLGLLRDQYAESLDFMLNRRRSPLLARLFERRKLLRPSRIIFALLIIFALSTVLVRIRQTVSAEFEVVPAIEHIGYSPLDGVIAKCNFKSGDAVKKGGEIVIIFETDERKFLLDNARNEFMRTGAQLDLVRQQSFNDLQARPVAAARAPAGKGQNRYRPQPVVSRPQPGRARRRHSRGGRHRQARRPRGAPRRKTS